MPTEQDEIWQRLDHQQVLDRLRQWLRDLEDQRTAERRRGDISVQDAIARLRAALEHAFCAYRETWKAQGQQETAAFFEVVTDRGLKEFVVPNHEHHFREALGWDAGLIEENDIRLQDDIRLLEYRLRSHGVCEEWDAKIRVLVADLGAADVGGDDESGPEPGYVAVELINELKRIKQKHGNGAPLRTIRDEMPDAHFFRFRDSHDLSPDDVENMALDSPGMWTSPKKKGLQICARVFGLAPRTIEDRMKKYKKAAGLSKPRPTKKAHDHARSR